MDEERLVRIADRRPRALCEGLELDDATRALLGRDPGPTEFLTALLQEGLYADAVAYFARAFQHRDGVAWACACVRSVLDESGPETARAALAAAEGWVRQPTQEHCFAAQAAAEADGPSSPAGYAAMAAFWGGKTLSGEGLPEVPPPPELRAKGVEGAVRGAAVFGDPGSIAERYKAFLSRAIELARQPERR
jgi:hypothetical protein